MLASHLGPPLSSPLSIQRPQLTQSPPNLQHFPKPSKTFHVLVSLQIFSPLSTRSSLPHLPYILLFNAVQLSFLLRNSPHIPWAKISIYSDFPGGSDGKESACNARDPGSIPGSERSPGEGHSNPLQCSCRGESHGQRILAGYHSWGCSESDTAEWVTLSPVYTGHISLLEHLHATLISCLKIGLFSCLFSHSLHCCKPYTQLNTKPESIPILNE